MKLSIIFSAVLLILIGMVAAQEAISPQTFSISALGWLEGEWSGDLNGNRFEAYYTSPAGGQIISVSKEYLPDSTCFIEFERFEMRDGEIILTPYPGGTKSVPFRLTGFDPAITDAVFSNPGHDFPTEIRYHLISADSMDIHVSGPSEEGQIEFVLKLRRVN